MIASAPSGTPAAGRVAPLAPADLDAEQRGVLEGAPPLALFAVLVRHAPLLRSWLPLSRTLQFEGSLPARDRELLILRTAWNCRCDYQWGHHEKLGVRAGLHPDEIARVTRGPEAPGWAPFERALLCAADQLHAGATIDQQTWEALCERYGASELIELTALVGQYHAVAFAANALGVALEDGYRPLPG
jgi:4-carboxymuconolactone decarboxylase